MDAVFNAAYASDYQAPRAFYRWDADHPIFTTPNHTVRAGTITTVCARGFVDDPQGQVNRHLEFNPMLQPNMWLHNLSSEFTQGLFGGPWYSDDVPFYFHSFRTPLSVWIVRAGGLGLGGKSTISNTRPEYYYTKWLVNELRAVNRLAGRTVFAFVYVDDL